MGTFITSESVFKDTGIPGIKCAVINQLYYDDNCDLCLTPRNQWTDGYTIPRWLAWLAGGKLEQDLRAPRQHDLECTSHQVLIVNQSLHNLKLNGYLFKYQDKVYCYDLPIAYITVRNTGFIETNKRFKRMLETLNLPKWKIWLYYLGVHFNIGWFTDILFKKVKPIDVNKIYKGGCDKWTDQH